MRVTQIIVWRRLGISKKGKFLSDSLTVLTRGIARLFVACFASGPLIFGISSVAEAQQWAIAGLGVEKCEIALQNQDSDSYRKFFGQWVWGFWSGLNTEAILANRPYHAMNVFQREESVADAVLEVCESNPTMIISVAALTVYERLGLAQLN